VELCEICREKYRIELYYRNPQPVDKLSRTVVCIAGLLMAGSALELLLAEVMFGNLCKELWTIMGLEIFNPAMTERKPIPRLDGLVGVVAYCTNAWIPPDFPDQQARQHRQHIFIRILLVRNKLQL
jgi:hypothetical protein